MISVCVPFYPWRKDYYRGEEPFEVMIKGLNQTENPRRLELCIIDGGVEDVFINRKNPGRAWDYRAFHKRLRAEFKGKVNYEFSSNCIHRDEGGTKRFWLAKAVAKSVKRATSDNILIFGIDIYASKDLMSKFYSIVKKGTAWVPFAFNIPKGAKLEVVSTKNGYCWHTARGIVGIKKKDYKKVGGYEKSLDLVATRTDSDFYGRMTEHLEVIKGREPGLFHVCHYGSNASRFWSLEEIERLK